MIDVSHVTFNDYYYMNNLISNVCYTSLICVSTASLPACRFLLTQYGFHSFSVTDLSPNYKRILFLVTIKSNLIGEDVSLNQKVCGFRVNLRFYCLRRKTWV